jgi:hypothetical protein
MTRTEIVHGELDRIQRRSLLVGGAGLALCALGAVLDPAQFFRSYLTAYLFWIGIALGSLAILMLHHLVGGAWGFVIRRALESAAGTLPVMALLFAPLLFGLADLYVWARPDEVAGSELLQHKSPYLNVPFFMIRAAIYFAAWIGLAFLFNQWSLEQDRTADPSLSHRLQMLSGPGLLVYGLTMTFGSIDWVMSLEPEWFSTIYGITFMVGQGLAGLAFAILVAVLLADRPPLAGVVSSSQFHDLGNLLLAFVMLWAYMAFSQFLIIWTGNLPEEIPWYLHRAEGGWIWVGLFVLIFHFAVPFLLLLSRRTKRRLHMLFAVAMMIVVMRLVDLFWLVAPSFHPSGLRVHWMDLLAPIGVGGIWMGVFARHLKGRPLLPLHDPEVQAAFHHERDARP